MKPKILVLWHEPSNMIATCPIHKAGTLPMFEIVDLEFDGINPFYVYPLTYLFEYVGWVKLGEL